MKKRYLLSGFSSKDEAQSRNREYALAHGIPPDATTKYMFSVGQINEKEWGLEIPEEHLELLTEEERSTSRLKEIEQMLVIEPFIPMVFRYLEKEWVDEFFANGKLRLSSFTNFHNHIDEQRGDKKEGSNLIRGNGTENFFYAVTSHGHDAFVLSTSLKLDNQLYDDFNVDCCFVIENPVAFMQIVAQQIPEFSGLIFGPCLYQNKRIIERSVGTNNLDELKNKEGNIDMGKMFSKESQAGGSEVFFVKTNIYSPQHEYRFLWKSNIYPLPKYLDVVIPEAVQYCRKLERE